MEWSEAGCTEHFKRWANIREPTSRGSDSSGLPLHTPNVGDTGPVRHRGCLRCVLSGMGWDMMGRMGLVLVLVPCCAVAAQARPGKVSKVGR